jgi:hypothetical protein
MTLRPRPAPLPTMPLRLVGVGLALVLASLGTGGSCEEQILPEAPRECDASGRGCLPDEQCIDGKCALLGRCTNDTDCPNSAYTCLFPAQFCSLRPGFAEECSPDIPCDPGFFCALGRCRSVEGARSCITRLDCNPGQACDRNAFFCIDDGPCTLAEEYPELACDPDETCDVLSKACLLPCQNQCTQATEADDCAFGQRCDGACRCVDCLSDADCGAGLVCNVRAGRCQSENLCFQDADCENPLVCDPRTSLCQVPPPPCDDDFDCQIAEICNLSNRRCELPGGVCIDDRFEDNDTPASAERVNLQLDTPRLLDDLQLCPDDNDYYVFALQAGDTLTARVTRTVSEARATVWLLDAAGETSVAFAETAPRGDGTVRFKADLDEDVYLRINALLAPSPYDLTVERTAGTPCLPDFFEGEGGNNTPDTATPPNLVPANVDLVASICRGDVDHFAFDVPAGEGLRATLTFDAAAADLDLAFVSLTGQVLKESATLFSPEVLERRFTAATRVIVRVKGFGNAAAPYTLRLERIPPLVCDDPFEPDDEVPRPIFVPNVTATGLAPYTEDRALCGPVLPAANDRWAIALEDFERLVFIARPDDPDLRVDLTVENAAGSVLRRSPLGRGASAVTFDATQTGAVFVRAVGQGGGQGFYSIEVSRENQTVCGPDELEPNDTVATRVALPTPNQVLSICESDEDYFVVEGVAGRRLLVDLTFLHADGDLDLVLLGLDGTQILAVSDSLSDNEHIDVILPLDGLYTLRVFSLSSGATARYTLDARLASP